MTSPADRQVEALADVDRIARALHEAVRPAWPWPSTSFALSMWRGVVHELLVRDVIRVGARPNAQRPLEGQTRLEEFLDE
jgi:hypothetical protein